MEKEKTRRRKNNRKRPFSLLLTPPRRRRPLEQRVRPVAQPTQIAGEALQDGQGQGRGEGDSRDGVGIDARLVGVGLAALVPEVTFRSQRDAARVDVDLLEFEGGDAGDGACAGDLAWSFWEGDWKGGKKGRR